jgi:hypothetical protein
VVRRTRTGRVNGQRRYRWCRLCGRRCLLALSVSFNFPFSLPACFPSPSPYTVSFSLLRRLPSIYVHSVQTIKSTLFRLGHFERKGRRSPSASLSSPRFCSGSLLQHAAYPARLQRRTPIQRNRLDERATFDLRRRREDKRGRDNTGRKGEGETWSKSCTSPLTPLALLSGASRCLLVAETRRESEDGAAALSLR